MSTTSTATGALLALRLLFLFGLVLGLWAYAETAHADDGLVDPKVSGRMLGPILGVRVITSSVYGSARAHTTDFISVGKATVEGLDIRWHALLDQKCGWSPSAASIDSASRALNTWSRIVFGDRALPFKAVDIYLVAPDGRYRRVNVFLPGRERATLAIASALDCNAGERVLERAVVLTIHELSHFQRPWRDFPNMLSNEAVAFTIGACASLAASGSLPSVTRWYGAMPEQVLKQFMGSTEPSLFLQTVGGDQSAGVQGALTASANAWHLLGDEAVESEDATVDFFAYCRCLLDDVPDFQRVFPGRVWRKSEGKSCGQP